jgi:hypothetical protein
MRSFSSTAHDFYQLESNGIRFGFWWQSNRLSRVRSLETPANRVDCTSLMMLRSTYLSTLRNSNLLMTIFSKAILKPLELLLNIRKNVPLPEIVVVHKLCLSVTKLVQSQPCVLKIRIVLIGQSAPLTSFQI